MPLWLILIIAGAVLLVLGLTGIAEFLIWIGVAVLVVSLVLALVNRTRSRT
ncbi:hypothetical protein [Xylanimonas oleitrophica]|uniref:hypothetical protein n=1 Tax=Xylanimonas oleitrophica TaxID=2607479 RepID=UPI0015D0B141|nr:hypothetical protein [Xylanimonas oleitrophica]